MPERQIRPSKSLPTTTLWSVVYCILCRMPCQTASQIEMDGRTLTIALLYCAKEAMWVFQKASVVCWKKHALKLFAHSIMSTEKRTWKPAFCDSWIMSNDHSVEQQYLMSFLLPLAERACDGSPWDASGWYGSDEWPLCLELGPGDWSACLPFAVIYW